MVPNETEASSRLFKSSKTAADNVVVAVKAEKVISKAALAWALSHVVHPGDSMTLLAVLSVLNSGRRRFWNFPIWTGDCGNSGHENLPDRISEISESCSQMALQFHNQVEVRVRIKVVPSTPGGAVAAEAKRNGAQWVVLDKKLKQEVKHCMEELSCNIVTIKGSQPKVLRLNLGSLNEPQTPFFSAFSSPVLDSSRVPSHRMKLSTPLSSPEEPSSSSYTRTSREGSASSFDTVSSLFLVYEQNPLFEGPSKRNYSAIDKNNHVDNSLTAFESIGERVISLSAASPASSVTTNQKSIFWIPQNNKIIDGNCMSARHESNSRKIRSLVSETTLSNNVQYDQNTSMEGFGLNHSQRKEYTINSSIRDAVSLGRISSVPPPLCSICQHKTPAFGKPPRQFSYRELEEATDGFSDLNFLAEGGFGIVHRGVLRDGQVVAVKQLKCGGFQRDDDFCREVRVLSCAQHRNVVLLIGFCIQGTVRLLVYEYICNSSLDQHSHGHKSHLDWHSRVKIATGAARGLRYLHEDCRVGCIVHRDLRPNNILLTHDFEPLVADFGLARWHSDWYNEDRVIGSSGYLAPEYINSGIVSHKVDVYAFGMVLLELITGQRITELQHLVGNQFMFEWFNPLSALKMDNLLANNNQLLDPCLVAEKSPDFPHQLQAMGRAASLCLRIDPEQRPPMSKVLRVLEGGDPAISLGLDLNSVGCRSGHLQGLTSHKKIEARRSHSRRLSH